MNSAYRPDWQHAVKSLRLLIALQTDDVLLPAHLTRQLLLP